MKLQDGQAIVTGNTYDKFRTRNPIARLMQRGFLNAAREMIELVHTLGTPPAVLEVGCGPGDLAREIVPPDWQYVGFDIGLEEVDRMRTQLEHAAALQASAYELPFPSDSFDLILACEVFEHLEDPPRALAEIERVLGNGMLLLSVPWEPAWRGLNVLRGAYLSELGNTPGHVQHFSRRAIRDLVASRFEVVAQRRPLPWTMLLARSR